MHRVRVRGKPEILSRVNHRVGMSEARWRVTRAGALRPPASSLLFEARLSRETRRCRQVSNLLTLCRSGVFRKEREAKTHWPRGATAMADVARQNNSCSLRLGWLARAALIFWETSYAALKRRSSTVIR